MKKTFFAVSLGLSGWYCLSLGLTVYTTLETKLTGAAYTAYALFTRFLTDTELFGALMYFLFPTVFLILAVVAAVRGEAFTKQERILYCLPPILAGVPVGVCLFCIAVHWSPFGMELRFSPIYNLIVYFVWFLICLCLLCKPKTPHKGDFHKEKPSK